MSSQFLYRGVSESFHQCNDGFLKPKTLEPFTYCFHWDEPGLRFDSGARFGSTASNAVIRHQLNQEGFPTSGISTTPHFERSLFYVRGKSGKEGGYVFKIDRTSFPSNYVDEYIVSDYSVMPSIPEDDEVILVFPDRDYLPETVIVEVIKIPALP